MASTDTAYSVRFELPDLIEQGKANVLRARVYRAGVLVVPVSGSVSVLDAGGTAIVDAAAITVADSMATYSLSAPTIAGQTRSEGWSVVWTLVMPDGDTHVARNDAALVKGRLYSPITEADLYRVSSILDPSKPGVVHSVTSFVDKIDEAMIQLELRMIERGNRPNLVLSPSSLRETVLYLTLALIFEDFATLINPEYDVRAKEYRAQFVDALARMRVVYDANDDGLPDDGSLARRKGMAPSLWTNGRF